MAEGIEPRRRKDGTYTYRAQVWDARHDKPIRRSFPTEAAAKAWRHDMIVKLRRGEVSTSTNLTVHDAVTAWIEAATRGSARSRGRQPFAPGTIRSVEQNYRLRVQEPFGRRRLDRLTLLDLQEWVDELDDDDVHQARSRQASCPYGWPTAGRRDAARS